MSLKFGMKLFMIMVFFLISVVSFAGERYKVESITTQGQTIDISTQRCYKDSYIEINDTIATVHLSAVNGSSCKTATGDYEMRNQGNGRYNLISTSGEPSAELIIKNGKADYIQDAIIFTFKKVPGTTTSKNTTKTTVATTKASNSKATKAGRGVFAGVNFSGIDVEIFLRDDGTYTRSLDKPNWKTDVEGTYVINGDRIITTDKDGVKNEFLYTTSDKRTLLGPGGYYMFKADSLNKVPDGVYNFYIGSVAGNYGSSEAVSVAGGRGYMEFKGNKFTRFSGSFSSMSGSVGGGSSSSSKDSGTYTLKDGELTLKYNDGTVTKHSFFYIPSTKNKDNAMILLDGSIYHD